VQAGISKTQEETTLVPRELAAATEKVMDQLARKFGETIRCFANLGGHREHMPIKLLYELARTEDGYLSLQALKDRRPESAKEIERFIAGKYMKKFYDVHPEGERHVLYDEAKSALVIDDPQLAFYLNKTPESELLKVAGKSKQMPRNKVFVSYSHHDVEVLKRLQIHLRLFEREGKVDLWADTKIQAGKEWREEIREAIAAAKIALLLIGPEFLASDFIDKNELPPLLAAAAEEGVVIIPIIVSHCLFSYHPSLARFQAVNDPKKPFAAMTSNEQDELLVKVAQATLEALAF
jgi:hypothetical protein